MFINSAFAQTAADAASSGSSLTGVIVQLLLIFAIFYLLLIRPQQKKIKEHEAKLNAIKRGDHIVTGGGVFAKVIEINDASDELKVEIADNVAVKIARSTVREVLDPAAPVPASPANTNNKNKK